MPRGLFGTFECPLDEKNRAVLPSRLRDAVSMDQLRDGLWITRGFEGCLIMFFREDWQRLTRKVESLPFTNPDARLFKRFFFTPAHLVLLDRVGRVTISDSDRQIAGIDRTLIFNGVGDSIEIWSPDRWNRYCTEKAGDFEAVATRLLDGVFGPEARSANEGSEAEETQGDQGEER